MPLSDDVTAAWDEARPILADAFHPDQYVIRRKQWTNDGSGGRIETLVLYEDGYCALDSTAGKGREGLWGPQTLSVTTYEAEMPLETTLRAKDEIHINGRLFNVIAVRRGGDHMIFPLALLEEVS